MLVWLWFSVLIGVQSTQCAYSSCSQCSNDPACVWCLAEGKCTTTQLCPFTPYTDCCFLNTNCYACAADVAGCVFCEPGNTQTCQSNATACANPQPCTSQSYSINFLHSFLVGTFLAIGSILLLVSISLLIMYSWHRHTKNLAQRELEELSKEKHQVNQTIAEYEYRRGAAQDTYTTLAPLINKHTKT